jgi:RNA polymerase sigma-70 factor (ECF subfamily)
VTVSGRPDVSGIGGPSQRVGRPASLDKHADRDSADSDSRDDAALLAAHVAGDPEAFSALVRRHRDRLWAVALRTTGDREDAADGLQDGLVAAFRRAETFRGDAQVTTWLHRIVVNACLDRMRRNRSRPTESLPEDEDRATALAIEVGEDPAEAGERRADVMAALATLPDEQRAALVLIDMEGYSVDEAATMLGCAPGTVKSRCSRGRARLVPLLTQYRPASSADPARSRNHHETGDVQPQTTAASAATQPPGADQQDPPEQRDPADQTERTDPRQHGGSPR